MFSCSKVGKIAILAIFEGMRLIKYFLRFLCRLLLFFVLFTIFLVLVYKFVNPPFTPFILVKYIKNDESARIRKDWVDIEQMSPYLPLAVIAAEDQLFFEHHGFDLEAIRDAVEFNRIHERTRGASSISQQTAKNVFLFPTRSLLRKGLEAYFTVLIELLWSKERILEVYLNMMEQGENIYGVESSSQIYFKKDASEVSRQEAALMAAVLPNPLKFKIDAPSSYVLNRQQWILNQMNNLGGISFVDKLYD